MKKRPVVFIGVREAKTMPWATFEISIQIEYILDHQFGKSNMLLSCVLIATGYIRSSLPIKKLYRPKPPCAGFMKST